MSRFATEAASTEEARQAEASKARWMAVAGVGTISFSAIFVRLAAVSPSTAAVFRCGYALPFLLAIWWVQRRRDTRAWSQRWLPMAAGVALGLDFYFWHKAIDWIGAGLATVLGNTQVVFVGLAAWAIHRERPSRAALWMVPVVFAGVMLVSGLGRADTYGSNPVAGTLYGILTGVTYTVFLLAFRQAGKERTPPVGPLLDATLGATVASLVIGLLIDPDLNLIPTWPEHGWLLALAMLSQVLGWLFLSRALPRLPALETSVLLLMQPVLTVMWALLIFSERLSSVQWMGVTLVLGGIATLSIAGSVVRPPEGIELDER